MVYNRCVGTRYCSNNCPYKVRRFNFKLFSGLDDTQLGPYAESEREGPEPGRDREMPPLSSAPHAKKVEAEEQNREVRDGEILTACQQTCPTQAIVFGNIKFESSRVSKLRAQSRNYTC